MQLSEKYMRYRSLDNAKWILTLMMVLYHIQFAGTEKYYFSFMFIKNLGDCVVPAFAIISGFLFWKNVRSVDDLKGKIIRRIFSLAFPYVLWNIINTFFLNYQNGNRGIDLFDLNIWHNVIMWNSSPHFWYLFMLMFWTFFSPILYFMYRKKGGVALIFVLSCAYLVYKGDTVLHSRFIYLIYVWAGVIGYYFPNALEKLRIGSTPKLTSLVVSFFAYIAMYFIYCNRSIGMGLQVWLYGVRAVFLLFLLVNLPLTKLGTMTGFKYSFWIFAMHYWLDVYVGFIVGSAISNSLVYQLITWLVVAGVGLIIGIIIDKRFPVIFKTLSGR